MGVEMCGKRKEIFIWKNLVGREHLGEPGVDEILILKYNLNGKYGRFWTGYV
jgi:hypothetical protein